MSDSLTALDDLVAQKEAAAREALRAEAAAELEAKSAADLAAKVEAKRAADERRQREEDRKRRVKAVEKFAAGLARVLVERDCTNPREVDDSVIEALRKDAGLL